MRRHTRIAPGQTLRPLAAGLLLALACAPGLDWLPAADPPPVIQAQDGGAPRHIGYGISAAPFLEPRPDLLDDMDLNWVMLYSTDQLEAYPNQYVIYRIDFQPDPGFYTAWLDGLPDLITELWNRGVVAVQIGNEPNLSFEWQGRAIDPRYFTQSLCDAYRLIKQAQPDMIVVGAGIASTITTPDGRAMTDLDFLQQMLNYGGGRCFDALGYHPYGYNQPPEADPGSYELVFRRTERVYRLLWNNNVRDRQVWITEFGWIRDPAEGGLNCRTNPTFSDFDWIKFGRQTQADYTARAFQFADRNWPWVGPMILWNLNWSQYPHNQLDSCSHFRWFSILDESGDPLPVYYAVRSMPKRPPIEYRPTVSAFVHGLTRTAEAGCAGAMKLGSFTVRNSGYPGHLSVSIEPANGPGRPVAWTDQTTAQSGTTVEVFVDATGIQPGLHLVAINLTAQGTKRMSSYAVRGWLLIHYPTTPECVARYGG